MRHRKKDEKFSRSRAQRKSLIRALVRSLLIHERIITGAAKAKKIRPWAERLINLAKEDTLVHRRQGFRLLQDHNLVRRLFEVIAPRFKDISGGYTRIFDLGYRKGDGSKLAILELTKTERKEKKKPLKKEKPQKKEEKPEERIVPQKGIKPSGGLLAGVRRIFKKERDTL